MSKKTLIIIQGPTAIGKTKLSIKLAKHYQTEIISCDSRQFYKELKIGTAPPKKEELSSVKHHFIHNLSITEKYDAKMFEKDGINTIEKLFKEKEKIIMVGGSGLYINAICNGLDEMPDIDPSIREEIIQSYKVKGINYLQNMVKQKDPEFYNNVDQDNPQRLIRALEVITTSGKPISCFRKKKDVKRSFKIKKIGINIEREILYEIINRRVDVMMKNGLIDETKSLIKFKKVNALQTVGYKEMFKFFEKELNLEETVEKIKQNTRRLAKRQITWFKKDQEVKWFKPDEIEKMIAFIA